MKKFLSFALLALLLLAAAYYPLVVHSPQPSNEAAYTLDLNKLRRLAGSLPGDRANQIRLEKVAELEFAEAMVMAGEPWRGTPIPIYSYQLIFADRSIIVDTALASTQGVPGFMVKSFDAAAHARMNQAMTRAAQIFITHEHFDHIDGIAAHPRLAEILPAVRLTREQIGHPERMKPSVLPADVFANYHPLDYEEMLAVAPGVVLIKAPGHTPGSQMVYVQLQNGHEVLLLGDVSWQYRNIAAVRERPLFMTALIKENRKQVINQFQALHALAQREPALHLVPGHDQEVVNRLLATGVLQTGFRDIRANQPRP